MTLDYSQLPSLESAGRLGRAVPEDSPFLGAYTAPSQPVLDQLGSVGLMAASEMADLLRDRVFPGSLTIDRLRRAAQRTYTTYFDCSALPPYDGTCQQPCFGPPLEYMSPFYCATCTEQKADPNQNPPFHWHFTGSRQIVGKKIDYWGENHICAGKGAWKWKVLDECRGCSESSVIRCHDGYKQVQGQAAQWTICEGLVACDEQLQTCP